MRPLNEFELQEQQSAENVQQLARDEQNKKIEELRTLLMDRLYGEDTGGRENPTRTTDYKELASRIEDVENSTLNLESALVPLSSSDDLEDVKGRINQIIEVLNNTRI